MQPAQLDIFADSRDVMLRNDVLRALEDRDVGRAAAALGLLRTEFPHEQVLEALDVLVDELSRTETAVFRTHGSLLPVLERLHGSLQRAARQVFDEASARSWLAPLWRNLAQRCVALDYDAGHSACHAAPQWMSAGEWASAAEAVGRIESWRRIPTPLAWMTQARWHLSGLDAAWPLLAELAWLAPAAFDTLVTQIADPTLQRLRKKFDAEFEGEGSEAEWAWFPAWALVEDNRLAPVLREAQPKLQRRPEQTLRCVLGLLTLERQGAHRELIQLRKRFRDLNSGLYSIYMATR